MKEIPKPQEIEAAEKALQKLQRERKLFENLPVDKQVAIILHQCQCNSNHDDGCGWGYETGWEEKSSWTHYKYLQKARELLLIQPDHKVLIKLIEKM